MPPQVVRTLRCPGFRDIQTGNITHQAEGQHQTATCLHHHVDFTYYLRRGLRMTGKSERLTSRHLIRTRIIFGNTREISDNLIPGKRLFGDEYIHWPILASITSQLDCYIRRHESSAINMKGICKHYGLHYCRVSRIVATRSMI